MSLKIAILGGGVMGEALLSVGQAAQHEVVVAEHSSARAEQLRERYSIAIEPAADAVAGASLVVLAVKPPAVAALVEEISPRVDPAAVVLSLAAGITTSSIEAGLGSGVAVVRVMANTPALIGEGAFGVSAGRSCPAARLDQVVEFLLGAGEVVVVDEARQDAVTAVSGSGPAYVFYLAEAMITGGVELGLDAPTARRLVSQTLTGAAALLEASADPPAELRRRVTSPQGTTAAAIETFDDRGVQSAIIAGMKAAARRSEQLAR